MNQQQLVDIDPTPPAPPPAAVGERYPLQIEAWGEDGELLLSRGHHGSEAFRVAAQMFCVDTLEDLDVAGRVGRVTVVREWWRHAPSPSMGRGTEWEGMRSYKRAEGRGPGAFPVTFARVG